MHAAHADHDRIPFEHAPGPAQHSSRGRCRYPWRSVAMHAWHSCYQENDMRNDLMLDSKTLTKGRIRRVHQPIGQRVECLTGALWVTQDGDPRDIVLEPGD